MLRETFKQLDLSDTAHRIYLELMENGSSSARLMAEKLDMPRPTVYDNLKILIKAGIVTEKEEENKKVFQIDDPKNISHLIAEKIDKLKKQASEIENLLPEISKHLSSIEPTIKFYPGAEGIKKVLNDLLWHENIKTYAMWPISEMINLLGEDYIANNTKRKIKNNIWSNVIWPNDKKVDIEKYKFLGVGKKYLRNIRIAPKGMTWNMSYWMYGGKIAFISSRKESFGFVIHSRDFAELMLSQFKQIWKISKPI